MNVNRIRLGTKLSYIQSENNWMLCIRRCKSNVLQGFFSIDEKLFCSDNSKLFFFQSRKIESVDIARSKSLAGIDRSGFYCFGYCNVRAMISTFSHDSNNSPIKTAIGSNNSNKL